MKLSLLVLVGSALGGLARFWCGTWSIALFGPAFPWGTLAINVIGSFIIGLAATALPIASSETRALVMIGFCGGFTTFSSYSLQSYDLLQAQRWAAALAYMTSSVALCLLATTAGCLLGKAHQWNL